MSRSRFSDAGPPQGLAGPGWARCEALLKAFEQAWRRGEAPALADYLLADGAERRALLVELIHTDLELRLTFGEPARVESYLARYPELAGDRRATLGLLA